MKSRNLLAALIIVPFYIGCGDHSNDNLKLILQDPRDYQQPLDDCKSEICTSLLSLIKESESSIDFAIYGARNQSILLNALVEARQWGVRVRGIVDRNYKGHYSYSIYEKMG
jgi:phosphatidylserine/phosphatidylglycerophosphate/cardiolipin synthase-like enzyme